MILSKTCDYGLRAVFYIAAQQDKNYVQIREMAKQLGISFHFLTKILQILNQGNITISYKGKNGGVALARSANRILLKDVVEAIDGPKVFQECVLGLDQCGDENPCPLHFQWGRIRNSIKDMFEHTTLQDVAEKIKKNEFRLTNLFRQEDMDRAVNFG